MVKRNIFYLVLQKNNSWVSQKFCNILLTCGGVQQLWMLLQMPRNWIILACDMPNSPDTLLVLLAEFASVDWSTALESTVFGQPDMVWAPSFLQPKQNFTNHLWSTTAWLFMQQIFLTTFTTLWSSSNL